MLNEDIFSKLTILTDAAKYDVACTSSGVERSGNGTGMGNSIAAGICHSFSADGRCISLLKVLYTNECIYDCKYCINRRSNDVPRTSFTPEEIAELTIAFYRRNYIEGLFLSSGITKSPNNTMEQIYQALLLLRQKYLFHGYIHIKAIPGADSELLERVGWLADRMSINLELPTAKSLSTLAPHKTRSNILTPMRNIQLARDSDREFHGELLPDFEMPQSGNNSCISKPTIASKDENIKSGSLDNSLITSIGHGNDNVLTRKRFYKPARMKAGERRFVPAGQSTQMIIGATDDTDYEIIKVSEALYNKFDLKRVFYSAFMNVTHDSLLPDTSDGPQLLREHRLYQADWLLRFYHFTADEIISPEFPTLNTLIDPKCNYALNHLELFPVEVNTASYHMLLRVPGIGVKSAKRIIAARSHAPYSSLSFDDLKKLGIVLKRAQYFITCCGKTIAPIKLNQSFILANLLGLRERLPAHLRPEQAYEQLSLFDSASVVDSALSTIIQSTSSKRINLGG